MIDLTTVKTYEVLPSLAELHELNLRLKAKNNNLKGWLIVAGIIFGVGIIVLIINKSKTDGKEKRQGS